MRHLLIILLIAAFMSLQKHGIQAVAKVTASTTLDGRGSFDPNPNAHIVAFRWGKFSGGKCSIASPDSPATKVTGLYYGLYIFTLKVTASDGRTDTAHVSIKVVK
jgi:hypothetical protein